MLKKAEMTRRYQQIFILTCSVVFILIANVFFFHSTLDDAFITFRHAEHLADGHKLGEWNYGDPPIEGYTSMLWVLLLALGSKIGISVFTLSKIVGIFSHLTIFFLLYKFNYFARDKLPEHNWTAIGRASAVFAAFFIPMAWYSTTGMETCFFALLLLLFTGLSLKHFDSRNSVDLIVAILAISTRPEGILVVGPIYLALIIKSYLSKGPMKPIVLKFLCVVMFEIALTVWRWIYFGYPLPNTYYAKVADGGSEHIRLGLHYLYTALISGGYWLLLVPVLYLILLFVRRRRASIEIISWLVAVLIYILFIVKSGGDNWSAFPYYRHLIHIYPLLLLIFTYCLSLVLKYSDISVVILGGAVAIVILNKAPIRYPGPIERELNLAFSSQHEFSILDILKHDSPPEYFSWIKDKFPGNTRIAVSLGGALPYYTDFYAIDMLGLNDAYIAHYGTYQRGGVDTKTNMDYVIMQKPDLIETTINADLILQNKPHIRNRPLRGKMEDELIDNPTFKREYLFVKNAKYAEFPRALMIKQSFYEGLTNKQELEVLRVSESSLYPD